MERIYVVDLDGTLINGNSLNFFAVSLISTSLMVRNIYSLNALVKLLFTVAKRKLRLCTHDDMKQVFQRIWSGFESRGYKDILEGLVQEYLNKVLRVDVIDFIQSDKSSGDIVLLATAAPSEYVDIIVSMIPVFDGYVATPRVNDGKWFHNISENKWMSIVESFDVYNKEIISFTDHVDDLPLIENSNQVYLFLPIAAEFKALRRRYTNINFKCFYE